MVNKRVQIAFWGDAGPMTETEAALDELEPSWSDFAYDARPNGMARVSRRVPGQLGMPLDLLRVKQILDGYRRQVEAGDRFGAFHALVTCAKENVPLPYWLSNAILEIEESLRREPAGKGSPPDLHTLFGADRHFPQSATRGRKARRDLKLRSQLYHTVTMLMHDEKLSLEQAIRKARAALRFPYSQRKARELYDVQRAIQTERSDILGGRKVHRLR